MFWKYAVSFPENTHAKVQLQWSCKAALLKSHFGIGVILHIFRTFSSEHFWSTASVISLSIFLSYKPPLLQIDACCNSKLLPRRQLFGKLCDFPTMSDSNEVPELLLSKNIPFIFYCKVGYPGRNCNILVGIVKFNLFYELNSPNFFEIFSFLPCSFNLILFVFSDSFLFLYFNVLRDLVGRFKVFL